MGKLTKSQKEEENKKSDIQPVTHILCISKHFTKNIKKCHFLYPLLGLESTLISRLREKNTIHTPHTHFLRTSYFVISSRLKLFAFLKKAIRKFS